jgi:hypothetical protein
VTVPTRLVRAAFLVLPLHGGCDGTGDEGPASVPMCAEVDATSCTPLYAPTFDRVFSQTLAPRCGVAGGACHGESGADGAVDGGLVLAEEDAAHAILLEGSGASGEPFVRPGDAACSLLVVRLVLDDPELRMPPGTAGLPEGELCSVAQWVQEGAER